MSGKYIAGGSGVVAVLLSSCSFLLVLDKVSYIFTAQIEIDTCSPGQYTSTTLGTRLLVDWEQGWQWTGNKAGSGLGTRLAVDWEQGWQWTGNKAGSGLGTRLVVDWEQGWQWTGNKAGGGLGTRLAVDWEQGW